MRPKKLRRIRFNPDAVYFKPQGIPLRILDEITLHHEELEAVRLKYIKELDQTECAKKMGVSQSTFQRILSSANKKIAEALVTGKAIKINICDSKTA
jgi:predicted DNA-binding protein (UPF0251 family)